MKIEKIFPIWSGGIAKFSSGNGTGQMNGHAHYEVFYPTIGSWLPGDPAQQTANFTHVSNIWYGREPELSTLHPSLIVGGTINPGEIAPTGIAIDPDNPVINVAPTLTSNFQYVYHNSFSGPLNKTQNILLNSSDIDIIVGIWDRVEIVNPPDGLVGPYGNLPNNTLIMTPGSRVSFFALFSSGSNPITYATAFDWSIVLYYNGGTYPYVQGCSYADYIYDRGTVWQPIVGSSLPDYDWVYDANGNIYGEVQVTVHITDGDCKSDIGYIGVVPPPCIPNITNTTYNNDAFINACDNIMLQNVIIQNNSDVKIRSSGEININGPFEVKSGSSFETKYPL